MRRSENSCQLTFLDMTPPMDHVVNVASVQQRSPFRYPGGKTWLVPTDSTVDGKSRIVNLQFFLSLLPVELSLD